MTSPKELLLIDANIISHALTSNQTAAYVKLFEELEQTYKFVVTGYTKYEIMCSSDKDHREKIEEYLEQNMGYITLSKPLMDFAARLCFLYGKHSSTKGQRITNGDVVNAAFSIAKPCALLTIDSNDHPRPFFAEVTRHRITYISKTNRENTDIAYVLSPDVDHVRECFEKHEV